MRPLELRMRGFRSYDSDTTFAWVGRRLVGVVGPIGSGKSTILDAIAFALYGKTPRIERDTKTLINQRRDSCHVALDFAVDGTTWRAVRSLRRGGSSAHALYRLEGDDEVEVTDRARDMNDRVEALLGLDFEAFRRSVLLAQNQFAGFLEATATMRSNILKGVFGFDRLDAMRDSARRRLTDAATGLARLEERRRTADEDRRDLDEITIGRERAAGRVAELERARGPVADLDERSAVAADGHAVALQKLERLVDVAEDLPSADDTVGLFDAARASAAAVAAAEVAADRAVAEFVAGGGRDALDGAVALLSTRQQQHQRLERAEAARSVAASSRASAAASVKAATDRLAVGDAAVVAALANLDEAAAALGAAEVQRHRVHQEHRAAAVRSDLVAGEACPVCGQQVSTLPAAGEPGDMAEADIQFEEANGEVTRARDRHAGADREHAAAQAAAEAAAGADIDAAAAVARVDVEYAAAVLEEGVSTDRLADLLGEGDAEQLVASLRGLAVAAESRRTVLDQARLAAERSRRAIGDLVPRIASLSGRLEAEIDVSEDPDVLEPALRKLRDRWLELQSAANAAAAAAEQESSAGATERANLMESAGLAAGDDLVEVLTAAQRDATVADAKIDVLERRLADLAKLEEDEREAVDRHDVYQRLVADLAPRALLEYVLRERRAALAALAGVRFEALSAGRYRFTDDGDFGVVDLTAADTVRAPDSLSGGETFVASLALALALAEMVSRQGGRLDAFFLDEGFGSLDPEHVDLAMDGIERLVGGGGDRLVVVVSHLLALRDRIEDLIVLDKDELTGSTIVRSGAA